jgi:hypothetical protein
MAKLPTDEQIRAMVVESRAAQGLPPTITDLAVLERVAAIFARQPAVSADDVKPRRARQAAPRKRTASRRAA